MELLVCKKCGSDQIRQSVMVDYNTRKEIRSVFDYPWCDDCDCETEARDRRTIGRISKEGEITWI